MGGRKNGCTGLQKIYVTVLQVVIESGNWQREKYAFLKHFKVLLYNTTQKFLLCYCYVQLSLLSVCNAYGQQGKKYIRVKSGRIMFSHGRFTHCFCCN